MSTVNNRPSAAPVTATSSSSSSQATSTWKSALETDAKFRQDNGMLTGERVDNYKKNVESDMNKFVAENPNATPEELKKATDESISKHAGHEMLGQMQFDYFIKKMESRAKELRADMWK